MKVAILIIASPFVLLGALWQCAAAAFVLGRTMVAEWAKDNW